MPDGMTSTAPMVGFVSDPFLRIAAVLRETGLTRSALYRRMKAGTFPEPYELGGGIAAWRGSEITRWKAERPKSKIARLPEPVEPPA